MTILYFVIVLGTLVFVHELGHFVLAKLCGVYVDCFSLGFGPRLIWLRLGETEYRISLIPLGGYVRMAGQSDMPDEDDKAFAERIKDLPPQRRYDRQSVGRRMAIILAGPIMNLLFALPVAYALLTTGVMQPLETDATTVGEIVPGSPAQLAGLLPGDRVLRINDVPVKDWNELTRLTRNNVGNEIQLTYERSGRQYTVLITPVLDMEKEIMGIGVQQMERAQIAMILSNTPAAGTALQVGDIIDRLIGVRAEDLSRARLIKEIRARPNTKLVLRVQRMPAERLVGESNVVETLRVPVTTARSGGIEFASVMGNVIVCDANAPSNFPIQTGDRVLAAYERPLAPEEVQEFITAQPAGDLPLTIERITGRFVKRRLVTNVIVRVIDIGTIGVLLEPAQQRIKYPPAAAVEASIDQSVAVVADTFAALKMMVQQRLGVKALAGPLAIARMTGRAARAGMDVLLQLVLVITINLGILNLLPIPVLDGGHMVMLSIEGLIGRPLPMRLQVWIQHVGVLLLLGLFSVVMYNDALRWLADHERLGLLLGQLVDAVQAWRAR